MEYVKIEFYLFSSTPEESFYIIALMMMMNVPRESARRIDLPILKTIL